MMVATGEGMPKAGVGGVPRRLAARRDNGGGSRPVGARSWTDASLLGSGPPRDDGLAGTGSPAASNADKDTPASNPSTRGGVSAVDAATIMGS